MCSPTGFRGKTPIFTVAEPTFSEGKTPFSEGKTSGSLPHSSMKKLSYLILIGVFSCQVDKGQDHLPPVEQQDAEWMTYEGRVPLDEQTNLFIELSIQPSGIAGEGRYQMEEFMEVNNHYTPLSSFTGNYSTLYGESPDEMAVQFHNSAQPEGVRRTYLAPGFKGEFTNSQIKMIREEPFRQTDLVVKNSGNNTLVILDNDLKPITANPGFNLTKRSSPLFTVEGYFRHNGDTADFLEMNTGQAWAVSKLGDYEQAIRQYHQLAHDKFEVTYLKGIGFSIRHINKEGVEGDALVLKKVLQMTSSPELTDEYNRRVK